jgi:hypothetical protein
MFHSHLCSKIFHVHSGVKRYFGEYLFLIILPRNGLGQFKCCLGREIDQKKRRTFLKPI